MRQAQGAYRDKGMSCLLKRAGRGSMMKPADCKIFTEIEELLEFKDENAERILESDRGVKK